MKTLIELAEEYEAGQEKIEQRIAMLEQKLSRVRSREEALRLRKRIWKLKSMSGEMSITIYQLRHYYDKD